MQDRAALVRREEDGVGVAGCAPQEREDWERRMSRAVLSRLPAAARRCGVRWSSQLVPLLLAWQQEFSCGMANKDGSSRGVGKPSSWNVIISPGLSSGPASTSASVSRAKGSRRNTPIIRRIAGGACVARSGTCVGGTHVSRPELSASSVAGSSTKPSTGSYLTCGGGEAGTGSSLERGGSGLRGVDGVRDPCVLERDPEREGREPGEAHCSKVVHQLREASYASESAYMGWVHAALVHV